MKLNVLGNLSHVKKIIAISFTDKIELRELLSIEVVNYIASYNL